AGERAQAADLGAMLQTVIATDPRVRSMALLAADGTALASSDPAVLGSNFGFRRYFRDALKGLSNVPEVLVSVPQAGQVPLIAYSEPVHAGGRVVGVAVLFAHAQAVWDLIRPQGGENA